MFTSRIYRMSFATLLLIGVLSAFGSVCEATTYRWISGAGNPTGWSESLNWDPTGVPSGSSDSVVIPGSLSNYPIISSSPPITIGDMTIDAGATILINGPTAGLSVQSAAINGTLTVNTGIFSVYTLGGFTIGTGGNMTISGGTITSYSPITNNGTGLNGTVPNGINIFGGIVKIYNLFPGKLDNNGSINWSGGNIESFGTGSGFFPMTNSGRIDVIGTGGIKTLKNCNFTNASTGTLAVGSGNILQASGDDFKNQGIINGNGTIDVSSVSSGLTNETNGKINPGLGETSPANLTIIGKLVQNGGELIFNAYSAAYDSMTVNGNTELNSGNVVLGNPNDTSTPIPTGDFTLIGATGIIYSSPPPVIVRSGYTATILSASGSDIFKVNMARNPVTATWVGTGTNRNWLNPQNWDTGSVPGASDSVIIPGSLASGANWPVIENDSVLTIANLTIEPRTDPIGTVIPEPSLAAGPGPIVQLTITDSLINNGTIALRPASKLIVKGSFINGNTAPTTNPRPPMIDVQYGAILNVVGTDLQNKYGVIRGRGTINITPTAGYPSPFFINEGRVEPGALYLEPPLPAPPYFFGGILTINGNFKQQTGTLVVDVRPQNNLYWDTTSAPTYNRLQINGTAEVGGNLIFKTMDYVPAGDYDVVQTTCTPTPCINSSFAPYVSGIPGASVNNAYQNGTILRVTVPCSVYKWTGSGSTPDWTNPNNWGASSYPNGSSVSVLIPGSTTIPMPQINSNTTIDICGITLEPGASLAVNQGGTLNIHRGGYYNNNITIDGTLNLLGGEHHLNSGFSFTGTGLLVFGSISNLSTYPVMLAKSDLNLKVPLRWESGVVEPEYGVTTQLTMMTSKNAEIVGSVGTDAAFKKLYGIDLSVSNSSVMSLKTGIFYLGNKANFKVDSGVLSVDGQMSFYNYDDYQNLSGTLVNNAIIGGTGTLSFAPDPNYPNKPPVVFTNNGTISPGSYNISTGTSEIGTLTIQHPNSIQIGTLDIQINSAATGGYDVLNVVGGVTLGGTLNVTADSTYIPNNTDYFDILHYSVARSGTFASVSQTWNPEYADSEKVVRLRPQTTTSYTLTVSVSPSGSGKVSIYPLSVARSDMMCPPNCSISVASGTTVSLYAIPNSGNSFLYWRGAVSGSFRQTEILMNGNKSVTAYFSVYVPSDPPYIPPDACPGDPNKTEPGICGCGVADTDSDGDGTPDCKDLCPNSAIKSAPGACGCDKPDTDSDGDGVPDCNDLCPNNPTKSAPGACGCDKPDTDSDGDGTPDCIDACPSDPKKTAPGKCGCGKPETENCVEDKCPNDPAKIEPGICGCGVSDRDSDGDGTPDCNDLCPSDPKKTAPGKCGCGKPESENCVEDKCPNDPAKIEPGICGCGVADTDSDGDGVADCNDGCPNDPKKTTPGICGCGIPDTDTNGDGIADCQNVPPPKPPTLILPKLLDVIPQLPLMLRASPFASEGTQSHLETHWLIQRTDRLYLSGKNELFEDKTVSSANSSDMTSYVFADAATGLKYAWSGISSFIVGILQKITPIEVKPGTEIMNYRMISFPYWTQSEKLEDMLKHLIGEYDRRMFRIGTYDPVKGGYVEYGEGLELKPGKAYWILSRNGIKITFDGVPVSLNHALDMKLDQGWNMIAPPNNASYDWNKVEVLVYDDDGKVVYSGLISDTASQEYIDLAAWLWVGSKGSYAPTTTLNKDTGSWVKVKKSNVVIRFPETARLSSTIVRNAQEQMLRFAESLFTPKQAIATSAETPPMPMGNTGFTVDSDGVDAGGGCFIDSAAK